jgi:heme-degrading monooxygenase HmoA
MGIGSTISSGRKYRPALGHRERGIIHLTLHRTKETKKVTYQLIQHTVADYAKWKIAFDEHMATRKTFGSRGAQVMRSADNPSAVTVLVEWDSTQNAQRFADSDTLREAMEAAGVTSAPSILYFDRSEKTNA